MVSLLVSLQPLLVPHSSHNKPRLRFSLPRLLSFSPASRNSRSFSIPVLPADGSDAEQDPVSRSIPFRKPSEDSADDVPRIADEWGEPAVPEPETPSEPDPPRDEDEWGKEPGVAGYAFANGNAALEEDDKVGDLKRCLVDTLYGTELGFRASAEVRAEIFELVAQLEALNPTPAPTQAAELLDGNWILLFTAFSELLPLLAVGATPLLKVKRISQTVDTKTSTIVNAATLTSPFATFTFSASASYELQTSSRIQVEFKEGTFQPPDISSSVELPENVEVFGQKIDLIPVRRALNPVQETFANIARTLSGQAPLKVPIPGNRAKSWLLITHLDKDFRISRGDGGLFVLAKEGCSLLDLLS